MQMCISVSAAREARKGLQFTPPAALRTAYVPAWRGRRGRVWGDYTRVKAQSKYLSCCPIGVK
jgi:hypothetical protein